MNYCGAFLVICLVFCLANELSAGIKTPAQRLREKDESGEEGFCTSKCDVSQNQDIHSLQENITKLTQTVQEFRTLLTEISNHHTHHHEHQSQNQDGTGKLVNSLVSGVQRPFQDVADNLNSDYFPFPENSHRPAEHFGPGSGGQGGSPHSHDGSAHGHGGSPLSGSPHGQSNQNDHSSRGCAPHYKHLAAFLRPPRVRSPEEFDFGFCHVRPNSALSPDDRQNVHGIIILSQKKNSNTLYMSLRLSGFNTSHDHKEEHSEDLHETQQVTPLERFTQETIKTASFNQQPEHHTDATSGHFHGFHVHEKADLSNGCESTGAHYNPYRLRHGSPKSPTRHVGDFGNIDCDDEGSTNLIITDEVASLRGAYSIIGKPLVIHANRDDLGIYPGDTGSTSTGNSGPRLACCIIERVPASLYNEGTFARTKMNENLDQHSHTAKDNIKHPPAQQHHH